MWTIRPNKPEDFNFIANSYLKSYRTGPEAKHMVNDIYFPEYKERLTNMMTNGRVWVACSEADEDQIGGYVITGKVHSWDVLHYIYVKYPFRQMGLAAHMLHSVMTNFGERMTICTHLPKGWADLSSRYKLMFDPKYARSETK